MLNYSVGKNGKNISYDVKTLQKIINLRDDLRAPLPKLSVDGALGDNTQAAIYHIQSAFMGKPDGRVDPYGRTIRNLWPVAYSLPTGLGIRGTDAYGAGHFGASRGFRVHDGTDYIATPGQRIKSPLSGKVVKISRPYSSGIDMLALSGIKIIASDGTQCWVWYIQPMPNIVGSIVKAGNIIGVAKTLKNRYKNGITDHVHIRIHSRFGKKIDPNILLK